MSAYQKGVPAPAWDEHLRAADGHFLQCAAWQSVQEQMGSPVLWQMAAPEWMWAGHVGKAMGVRYMYVPCGPTIKSAAHQRACLSGIAETARSEGIAFVRFEPVGAVDGTQLEEAGAREVKPVQPKYTWVLDLRPDIDTLRRGLSESHRRGIKDAEKHGVSIRRSDDPADASVLRSLIADTAQDRGFHVASAKYFDVLLRTLIPAKAACLYIAEAEGEPAAAVLGFDFNGVRHYGHVGANPAIARRVRAAAPLVWQMILDAKDEGMHTFDFWGVLPQDEPGHPWMGFTKFKRAFGGALVERAGTFELTISQLRHRLFRLGRALR